MINGQLRWDMLPPSLDYLATPAEKYGHYQFDAAIREYLDSKMTKADCDELKMLRDRMDGDYEEMEKWLDEYNMKTYPESRLVYFMRYLVGTADDLGKLL